MNQEELQRKFQVFEMQIRQVQEQLQAIEGGIGDLKVISEGLNSISGGIDSEIMAPIGRGIFVKAKLLSEDLTVDIGEGKLVKKDVKSTQEMIGEQVLRLEEMQKLLEGELDRINTEITNTFMASQGEHSCHCGPEDDCEGSCGDSCSCH